MSNSRLDNFILFHLFKWSAGIIITGFCCLLLYLALSQQTQHIVNLLRARDNIDMVKLKTLGHLVLTNSTPERVIKDQKLNVLVINHDPYQIVTDINTAARLESAGIVFSEAAVHSNQVTATLAPYPPILK